MKAPFQKVVPVSKKDCVNKLLKEAIVSGAIACGDQIVEATVARQFGVGPGLVREALIELAGEGFIDRTPFSNTRVASFSNEDAGDIFDIRIELEPAAFDMAMRNLGPNDTAHLRKLMTLARKDADSGDVARFFDSHLAFFRTVWELSGNKYLHQTLERVVVPLFVLYLTPVSFECRRLTRIALACSGRQEQILEAIETRDGCEVKRVVADCLIQMKAIIVSE
jgi:DNA-binding GntR family transcriptional regulator